jgi:DNA-binding GntR family transcriptional regulator
MREHEQILEAIRKRDGQALAALILVHMMGSWEDFERTYREAAVTE